MLVSTQLPVEGPKNLWAVSAVICFLSAPTLFRDELIPFTSICIRNFKKMRLAIHHDGVVVGRLERAGISADS